MAFEKYNLETKTALITGAAGLLGQEHAAAILEAGARVILTDVSIDRLELVKKKLIKSFSRDLINTRVMDVTKPDNVNHISKDLTDQNIRVDILVNNAGVAQHGELEEFNDDLLDKIMHTNVDSVFRMCRSAKTPMKKQGGGVILNIGSISGLVSNIPQPQAAYNASKAAVHMLTKSLASDYAEHNIRVNALAPGYFRTDMTDLGADVNNWYPKWKELTPMKRMAETEEIAPAALFLCSPASSYVSGEVLVIDGAYTTR